MCKQASAIAAISIHVAGMLLWHWQGQPTRPVL